MKVPSRHHRRPWRLPCATVSSDEYPPSGIILDRGQRGGRRTSDDNAAATRTKPSPNNDPMRVSFVNLSRSLARSFDLSLAHMTLDPRGGTPRCATRRRHFVFRHGIRAPPRGLNWRRALSPSQPPGQTTSLMRSSNAWLVTSSGALRTSSCTCFAFTILSSAHRRFINSTSGGNLWN